jgi:uncharacterized damage-inducible protein DinB
MFADQELIKQVLPFGWTTEITSTRDGSMVNEKQQFINVFERELPTTLKVLRAFPAEKSTYKPHEKSNSAHQLAWTFVIENNMAMGSLKGPLNLGGGMPKAPESFQEIVETYEKSATEYMKQLKATPDSRLDEKIPFPSGPGKMGEYRVMDFLWFMFLDAIHHRGQLSTYLRPVGARVPAIYGPSGDEPWF